MISEDLLDILQCPETQQPLRVAEGDLIAQLNTRVRDGILTNRVGQLVEKMLDGGLVREDGKFLYPIMDDIPILLIDESIALDSERTPQRPPA